MTTTTDQAAQIAPGLSVFRLPDDYKKSSPHRWRIGHHSGLAIADAMCHEHAVKGAELLRGLADWTQDADTLRTAVNADDLYVKLSYAWCIPPASELWADGADLSRNGRYTDDDIRKAAAEFKADGYNAYEILCAMAHRVPWMGLDTEPFNEAHDRIYCLADAA